MTTQASSNQDIVTAHAGAESLGLKRRAQLGENFIELLLFICGFISIFTTIGIVIVLGRESISFFGDVPLEDFFTGSIWSPTVGEFSILPLVSATLMTSGIAIVVALPLGLGSAIYLSEYANVSAKFSSPYLKFWRVFRRLFTVILR